MERNEAERPGSEEVGPQITVTGNGPYAVRGGVPVRSSKGELLGDRARYLLCRCGGSANKPFCDGTHAKGFDGTEVADRGAISGRRKSYVGDGITIYDDRSVCSDAGRCTDSLAQVFKMGAEPWIDARGATAEAIATVIRMCPSGALSYASGESQATMPNRSCDTLGKPEAARTPGMAARRTASSQTLAPFGSGSGSVKGSGVCVGPAGGWPRGLGLVGSMTGSAAGSTTCGLRSGMSLPLVQRFWGGVGKSPQPPFTKGGRDVGHCPLLRD